MHAQNLNFTNEGAANIISIYGCIFTCLQEDPHPADARPGEDAICRLGTFVVVVWHLGLDIHLECETPGESGYIDQRSL